MNILPSGQRSRKTGMLPGTLIHIGAKTNEAVNITCFDYNQDNYTMKDDISVEDALSPIPENYTRWINVSGVHEISIISKIGEHFGIHHLVLEDILNTQQRPKFEDHDDYIYIVLRELYLNKETKGIRSEQVSLLIGQNYLVSFLERQGEVFDPIRNRIIFGKGLIRKNGSDYLAYGLIDTIIDYYFLILDVYSEKIEDMEDESLADPKPETLSRIQKLKGDMITLRKGIWPLRDVIVSVERSNSRLINDVNNIYFKDVHDHVIQAMDLLDIFRDMLASFTDVYLSSMTFKLNEVMKVLAIISTIFIPLTFIAGVYGMNFEFMPELRKPWGYPLIVSIMFSLGVVMLIIFKRKRWL